MRGLLDAMIARNNGGRGGQLGSLARAQSTTLTGVLSNLRSTVFDLLQSMLSAVLSGTNQDGTTFTLGVTESDTTISTETEIIRQNQEAILLELGRIGMLLTLLVGEEVAPSDVDSFLLTNQ